LIIEMRNELMASDLPGGQGELSFFPETHWSVVLGAGGRTSQGALHELVKMYWRPLYYYARAQGRGHEDAADEVQGFFVYVSNVDSLRDVGRGVGKFRIYLLEIFRLWRDSYGVAQHRWRATEAARLVPWESADALAQMAGEYAEYPDDLVYDREWAVGLVRRAMDVLGAEYRARGRGRWFEELAGALPGGSGIAPYAEVAAALGATEIAARKAAFDLRKAFAQTLRREIRATVTTNDEAEAELRYLVDILRTQ
jgi:RNA polymerase sigma-70 factor (ECF subfamily)